MSLRNVLSYLAGSFVLFILGPALILYLATLWHYTFMPEGYGSVIFGGLSSAVGLLFIIWSNYELIKKGHGGAVVIGSIKLSDETIKLVTTGPYSMCRNPMHLGVVLFYLGLCCAINSLITLIVPLVTLLLAYLFAIFLDEPRLKRDFKEEYEKWACDVPQRFWPKARNNKN